MEKEVRYIQLPPIPEDIETSALEAIWLIARMSLEEKKDALKQIEAMLGDVEDETIFSQYIECFRNLLAGLILESYDVAAFVYQKRCVEGLGIEGIMKNTRLSREQLNVFVKYFDARQNANE